MAGSTKRDETGRIESVNEGGVRLNGRWLNYSRFFKGLRDPDVGVTVSAVIGESGDKEFLNELVVVGSALPNGGGNSASIGSTTSGQSYSGGRSSDTNERIARQVALKCAIEFNASAGSVPEESVVISSARIFEQFLAEPYGVAAEVEGAA